MVVRVITGGVGREAARRAMLEALVHRQNDHLAGTTETAFHQDAGQIALGPRIVALVVGEDLFDAARDLHCPGPDWFWSEMRLSIAFYRRVCNVASAFPMGLPQANRGT